MGRRIALAAVALAVAAGAVLMGGALRGGPIAAPSLERAAPLLQSGFGAGNTASLIRRLEGKHDARSLTLLGLAYQQRARETGAPEHYGPSERALRRALVVEPTNAEAVLGLAALAASRHRFDEALVLARQARVLRPDNAAVYGVLGDANLELGRYRAAFAAFDRAAELRPGTAAYARVSYARELLGGTPSAIEAMKLAVDSAGASGEPAAWARVQLGNLYLGRGRLAEADERYRQALLFQPNYAQALAGLGEVSEARGKLRRAAALYRRALTIAPVPELAVSLGDVLSQLGDSRAARRAYQRSAVLEARFAAAGGRNQLETAMFDLDHDRHVKAALARAVDGRRLRPSIEGDHVLAWALYKNDRCAEARGYSIRALRLGTPDLDALYHRSAIERCLGRTRESDRFLDRLRSLNPYYLAAPPSARRFPAGG